MTSGPHVGALDGWRGVSILLVLAAHLLPLSPASLPMNVPIGILGMVIFFVLSGFLITSILLTGVPVADFLVRRFCRVVPLAWLYVAIAMLVSDIAPQSWWPHFLFYANLPPQDLVPVTEHMWSLCVEVQFYVGIALWYALTGVRGLWVLPVVALGFTSLRVWNDVYASSLTIDCIDQILAGCVLALVWHGRLGTRPVEWLKAVPQWLVLLLLVVSCFDVAKVYLLRPYLAAILVGTTLVNPEGRLANWLKVRPLVFVAGISYALYVIHPMLSHGWLGSGDLVEKYAKRPLLFAALFALAYLSTRYYERRWVSWGKRLIDGAKPAMR